MVSATAEEMQVWEKEDEEVGERREGGESGEGGRGSVVLERHSVCRDKQESTHRYLVVLGIVGKEARQGALGREEERSKHTNPNRGRRERIWQRQNLLGPCQAHLRVEISQVARPISTDCLARQGASGTR